MEPTHSQDPNANAYAQYNPYGAPPPYNSQQPPVDNTHYGQAPGGNPYSVPTYPQPATYTYPVDNTAQYPAPAYPGQAYPPPSYAPPTGYTVTYDGTPVYPQPYVPPPGVVVQPVVVEKNVYVGVPNQNNDDFAMALVLFILGWFCLFPWCCGAIYFRSMDQRAKMLGYASMALAVICSIAIIVSIIAAAA